MLWEMIFPFFNWFKKRWATTSMICWRVIPKVRFNGSDSLSTGLKLAKHEKSFSFLRWNRDNEKFIKSCSDSSGLSLQRKRLGLQQQTSARFNNSEVFPLFWSMQQPRMSRWAFISSPENQKTKILKRATPRNFPPIITWKKTNFLGNFTNLSKM